MTALLAIQNLLSQSGSSQHYQATLTVWTVCKPASAARLPGTVSVPCPWAPRVAPIQLTLVLRAEVCYGTARRPWRVRGYCRSSVSPCWTSPRGYYYYYHVWVVAGGPGGAPRSGPGGSARCPVGTRLQGSRVAVAEGRVGSGGRWMRAGSGGRNQVRVEGRGRRRSYSVCDWNLKQNYIITKELQKTITRV